MVRLPPTGERRFRGGRVTCRSAPDTQRPTAVTLAPAKPGGLARNWSPRRISRHTPRHGTGEARALARTWSPRWISRHTSTWPLRWPPGSMERLGGRPLTSMGIGAVEPEPHHDAGAVRDPGLLL